MYSKLHEHFSRLADEIEAAMSAKLSEQGLRAQRVVTIDDDKSDSITTRTGDR